MNERHGKAILQVVFMTGVKKLNTPKHIKHANIVQAIDKSAKNFRQLSAGKFDEQDFL